MGALLVEAPAGADDTPANHSVSRHCFLEFGDCLLAPGDHWSGSLTQTAKLLLFVSVVSDGSQTIANLCGTLVDQSLRRGGAIRE